MSVVDLYRKLLNTTYEVHTTLTVDSSFDVTGLGEEVGQLLKHIEEDLITRKFGEEQTKFKIVIVNSEGDKYAIEITPDKYWEVFDKHQISEFLLNAINNKRKQLLNNIYYA